ncbi:MAG: hypothetical protein B6U76_09290 [Desulfurococcales archaeon ex4484_217_2]|nr:MAG: hypothetical protein B6U76_09290 [Desulfurococcales archaeon ex4484_217_2]
MLEEAPLLDNKDKQILEIIRKFGGEVAQTVVVRYTGLPKSTISRKIRKLEKLGYIRVIRRGRVNILKIIEEKK